MLISSMTTQSPVRPGSPVFGPVTEELRDELFVELDPDGFAADESVPDEFDPGLFDPDVSDPGVFAVHFPYSVRSAVTGVVKLYAFRHCASVYQPPKV